MALPPGWVASLGLPLPSGRRSLRFFAAATTSGVFSDHAYNFAVPAAGADPVLMVPPSPVVRAGSEVGSGASPSAAVSTPMGGHRDVSPAAQASPVTTMAASTIRVFNDGADDLEFSFDGTNIHGVVKPASATFCGFLEYRNRMETGIAVRGHSGAAVPFRIEAW